MISRNRTAILLPLALGPLYSVEAICEIYMSDVQAASALFPNTKFEKKTLTLTTEEIKSVESKCDESVRWKDVVYFIGPNREVVYIDRALGKHEFITYAVGVQPNGKVKGIEILEYRESFGREVRRDTWRAQFVGKDVSSPFKVDEDIKSLSGATLSSVHITRGVKRVLHTHELISKKI